MLPNISKFSPMKFIFRPYNYGFWHKFIIQIDILNSNLYFLLFFYFSIAQISQHLLGFLVIEINY